MPQQLEFENKISFLLNFYVKLHFKKIKLYDTHDPSDFLWY